MEMTEKVLGSGIYVDTDGLRRVGGILKGLNDQVGGDRRRFSTGGHVSGDAFGVLSPAAGALSQYRKVHHDALTILDKLIKAVEQMSTDLNTSADNYDFADQGRL